MMATLDWMLGAPRSARSSLAHLLTDSERAEFRYYWEIFARPDQLPPAGDWRIWMIMAGRGFGKTRAGAEWVRMIAEANCEARIALVGSSLSEARSVMVEGESGLLACSPPERKPIFEPSLSRVRYPNGALVHLFSANEPESLRGPQHSHAWCDEIAKWPIGRGKSMAAWDNLTLGLRLGSRPRIAVTTTPRAVPLVQRLIGQAGDGSVAITGGTTFDNEANLSSRFLEAIQSDFGHSLLARQEIGGELVTDTEGALWTRTMIEDARDEATIRHDARVIVAVDPPASSTGDECGIIVAAIDDQGIGSILADRSIANPQPSDWAKAVASAAKEWEADCVIAEANQGGEMVESVLRSVNSALPIKLVRASRGKVARAEPIAALYSAGRVKHRGQFPQLEDQMCGFLVGGGFAGPGRSPDRADALVWALSELMLSPQSRPGVRAI